MHGGRVGSLLRNEMESVCYLNMDAVGPCLDAGNATICDRWDEDWFVKISLKGQILVKLHLENIT